MWTVSLDCSACLSFCRGLSLFLHDQQDALLCNGDDKQATGKTLNDSLSHLTIVTGKERR